MNPVSCFEIPATDLERAIAFYSAVFGTTFERADVDGNAMAFFPYALDRPGASGALVQGDSYTPGHAGARLYFTVQDIRATLNKAIAAGGRVLYPPTLVGGFGEVADRGLRRQLHCAARAGGRRRHRTLTGPMSEIAVKRSDEKVAIFLWEGLEFRRAFPARPVGIEVPPTVQSQPLCRRGKIPVTRWASSGWRVPPFRLHR